MHNSLLIIPVIGLTMYKFYRGKEVSENYKIVVEKTSSTVTNPLNPKNLEAEKITTQATPSQGHFILEFGNEFPGFTDS